jgi:hypothetical protein
MLGTILRGARKLLMLIPSKPGGFLMTAAAAGAAPRRRGPRFGARPTGQRRTANKFNARKTVVDGITFDSAKEARRYQQLRLEERAGHISNLALQVPFPIHATRPDGERVQVAKYVADFTYDRHYGDGDEEFIVEDAKGVQTPEFKLKKKLVEAEHNIEILLT